MFEAMQLVCNAETIAKIFHSYSFNNLGELRQAYGFSDFLSKYSDGTNVRGFSWNENRFNFILGDELFVKVYPNKGAGYFLDGAQEKEAGVYEYIQHNNVPIRTPKMLYCGANGGYPYVALEYIRGRTVRQPSRKGNAEEEIAIISNMALLTLAAVAMSSARGTRSCMLSPPWVEKPSLKSKRTFINYLPFNSI